MRGGRRHSSIHMHSARNLWGHTHLIEVQMSNVALEGTAAASSKETMDNGHSSFLRLFWEDFDWW